MKFLLPVAFVLLYVSNVSSSEAIWSDVEARLDSAAGQQVTVPATKKPRFLRLDTEKLKSVMQAVPHENQRAAGRSAAGVSATGTLATGVATPATLELPLPDGETHTFIIEESPVMAPGLAKKYSEFKTYRVRSSTGAPIRGRLDLLPTGFHGYLSTEKGTVLIDPDVTVAGQYRSVYKHDLPTTGITTFSCGVDASAQAGRLVEPQLSVAARSLDGTAARTSNELLTYRLAVAATYEYNQKVAAGNVANTQAEIVTAINRVNEIYERDLGIFLQLVANNDQLIATDSNDGLTNNNAGALINESGPYIDGIIGNSAYDIGHVFSTGAGGLAQLQSVCQFFKADGVTGRPNPTGDSYYIDYVAHEIGHQFGANHTYNGTSGSCDIGRNGTTSYEPGSGSTIMAYAGICGAENLQNNSDATFHAGSIAQIIYFSRSGGGSSCANVSTTGNTAPDANAGSDYTIPKLTPFVLSGSATDSNGDSLSYQWDEMDLGVETDSGTLLSDMHSNPLFRSYLPSSSPKRTLPKMEDILAGVTKKGEVLPEFDRTMNFRLTVRDQLGGVDEDSMKVVVEQDAGPFETITASSSPVTIDVSQSQVIEWDVACTDAAPVDCDYVDITLSTNGGTTFPTTLISSTPNVGEATVIFPNITSSNAVIKVACSDNIFFDVTDEAITMARNTGVALLSTGTGAATVCDSAPPPGGGPPPTPTTPVFDISTALSVNIIGVRSDNVNDISKVSVIYKITGTGELFTFLLSNYGTTNLDLYLLDSNGDVITYSDSTNVTEQIKVTLVESAIYYLAIHAEDTGGVNRSYRLTTTVEDTTLTPPPAPVPPTTDPGDTDDSDTLTFFTPSNAGSDEGSSSLSLWFVSVMILTGLIRRRVSQR